MADAGADGFGIGTSLTSAPVIDFAFDIVELEGKLVAKRGKLGGKKRVWRCPNCLIDIVLPEAESTPKCPNCGGKTELALCQLVKNGKVMGLPSVDEIRDSVLSQLSKISI